MKSFKSFDDFVNESYGKTTGEKGTMPINEALFSFLTPDQKFKVDTDKPDTNSGEIAAFHFVMKMETEDENLAKQEAANQLAASSTVMNVVGQNIVFIAVTKDRERKLTGQHIFKGILSVRNAKDFDTTKAQPILTSKDGKLKLYDVKDAQKMGTQPVKDKSEEVKVQDNSGSSGSSGTGGTGGTYPWDWNDVKLDNPDAILQFLQEKLLSMTNGTVSGTKVNRGTKAREVKFAQLILKEKVFVEKYGDPAKKVQDKLGAADGDFGANTAVAFGMFFDGKDAEHNAVTEADTTYLAKFCKKVGITLDRLKQLWDLSGKGTSGSSGTSGTGGTGGTSGQGGFIYINKPEGATSATVTQAAPGETTNTTTTAPLAAPTGGTVTTGK